MKKPTLFYHLVVFKWRRRGWQAAQRTYVWKATFKTATDMESWVRQHPDFCGWVVPSRDAKLLPESEIGGYDCVYYNGSHWGLGYMNEAPVFMPEEEEEDE